MIEQKYRDAVTALGTTHLNKLSTDPRFNERDFIEKKMKWLDKDEFYSDKQKACIDKMIEKYIKGVPFQNNKGLPPPVQEPIERGRFACYKEAGGWQVYIDRQKIGPTVDYRAAQAIISWLETNDTITQIQFLPSSEGIPDADPFAAPVADDAVPF